MIHVEIFTHSSAVDGSIFFEEGDFRITSIGENECIVKSDFDKLLESVMDIETKKLKQERWYMFCFKRYWDDDGNGSCNQCWFELVETTLIENEM